MSRVEERAPALALENVTCGYEGTKVVERIDLIVPSGAIVGVLGPNGSGKSTVLKAIVGLAEVHAGRVLLDGADLVGCSLELAARRHRITYLGPDFRGAEALTVEENIALAAWRGAGGRARNARVSAILELRPFAGLVPHRGRAVNALSGGQRRCVALAMVEATEPRLALLDEPTAMLDRTTALAWLAHVRATYRGRRTAVVADPNPAVLEPCCDRILELKAREGTPRVHRAETQ